MRKLPLCSALAGLVLALGAAPASAMVIDPTDCGVTLSCETGPETATSSIVGIIAGLYPGITEVYKQDQGGGETGAFASDYSTAFFNSANDPEDALITWDGPGIVSCPNCFVLVKGGNSDPAWYLIDIGGWNGMEDLDLQDFWPAQGAISHVSIWMQPVPVPAAVWLFGSSLLGFVAMGRRRRS